MLILNTRPADRAQPLTQALQQLGYQVQELPLLALCRLPLDEQLRQQFSQLLEGDVVVVVSSIAAEIGIDYAQQCQLTRSQLQALQWVAVGQTTQKKLQHYGLHSQCPAVESSEGMLSLPMFAQAQQRVAFWRGVGGRTIMIQQLLAQGCDVQNMLLYTRQMPELTWQPTTAQGLSQRCVVLISSEASWRNWLQLWKNTLGLTKNFADYHYVVLGLRVSQLVKQDLLQMGVGAKVAEVQQLNAADIHQQIQQIGL
jgi:uroporphyrinogen-III synthase